MRKLLGSFVILALAVSAVGLHWVVARAQTAASVSIASPTPGQVIQDNAVLLELAVDNLRITDQAERDNPNEGHFHITLDDRPFVAAYTSRWLFSNLEPGNHTIKVEPVLSSHMTPIPGTQLLTVNFRTEGAVDPNRPRLEILRPRAGEVLPGSTAILELGLANWRIVENATRDDPKEGHFHITLDNRPFVAVYSPTAVFDFLPQGTHRLRIEPVLSSHMVTVPGLDIVTVEFTTTGFPPAPAGQEQTD